MAASMFAKGLYRARGLCVIQNDLESLFTLQRQQCRLKNTATKPKIMTKGSSFKKEAEVKPKKKYARLAPIHSIYITEDYPVQKFSFEDCITMHKEAAMPEMSNTLHAQVYADIELDLTTNKKTKFMKNVRGLLEFPHKFEHGQKKDIFVFSENQTDWEQCKEYGATTVGGDEIIGYMTQGIIRNDDIEKCDFMFATPAMAIKLLKHRNLLKDKVPTLQNGCIVPEFESIIKKHIEGVTYKTHKREESVGLVQVPFGQLFQDTEKLEENFEYMVSILAALKPKIQAYYLKTIRVIAPPSTEIFETDFDRFKKTPQSATSQKSATSPQSATSQAEEEDSDDE